MQVEGHFVKDGVCVCVTVTTLAQSTSLPQSACRVVLNVPVGMLIGDRFLSTWGVVMLEQVKVKSVLNLL